MSIRAAAYGDIWIAGPMTGQWVRGEKREAIEEWLLDRLMPGRVELREAITRSGLPARRFAVEVLVRDERTVRKWLAGDRPIPDVVVRALVRLTGE